MLGLAALAAAGGPAWPDTLVPGTGFHATGQVPCAAAAGQPMGSCGFGVVRQGAGRAEVTIAWPDGRRWRITFANGRPAGHDAGPAPMTVRQEADLFLIAIGAARIEIPEAVVTGG